MKRLHTFASFCLILGAVACGGGGGAGKEAKMPVNKSGKVDKTGTHVDKAAAEGFDRALDAFADHDKKGDWAESSCNAVADQFLAASKTQESATNKKLPEALYNAGLAYQRCDKDAEARKQFEEATRLDSGFHRAKAQLALYDFAKSKDVEGTIRTLDQIIRDAKFQNVEALVSVAALQMDRNNDSSDEDGKNDMERAKRNLQRALAIDDAYMPAFNQLALFYLEAAKAKAEAEGEKRATRKRRGLVAASSKAKDVNSQQLDLAALVAGQGVRKNPNYAPLHNTSGLIQVELKNFNGAVKSFATARKLDPKFFEAHMNYAAVNLGFRGFEEAEKAYRDAIKLRPKEYEAHLGLALAIRGQIRPGDPGGLVAKAQAELDEAKKIDGSRPETYYNEAILQHEYRTKSDKNAIPAFEKAAAIYRQFIDKAGGDAAFADAVKRAKERTQDIDDTVKFLKEGEAAKAEADKQNAAQPAPPAGGGAATPAPPAGGDKDKKK